MITCIQIYTSICAYIYIPIYADIHLYMPMYTYVLYNQSKQVLTVPSEAIIYYENSPRVVKVIAKNKYQPVKVKIGMKSATTV